MSKPTDTHENSSGLTLVLGGSGKTGRRIVQRLKLRSIPTRIGSRCGSPSFDWAKPEDWDVVLDGVCSVYISYAPDLAVPGAADSIQLFVDKAVAKGVRRLVLLSGCGEEEAQACERIVQATDIDVNDIADVGDGIKRALGREAADFSEFARRIAARGTWRPGDSEVAA